MNKEFKSFPFKIRDVEATGEFRGYASTFGNVDHAHDVILPGAFKKTLKENNGGKVPILDHHDSTRQIGWNLEAREDKHGLWVRGQLDLNVQLARERHSLMQMASRVGARTGLSIGFQTVRAESPGKAAGVRNLKELKLFEYSIVVFPMNPEAGVTTVRGRDEWVSQFLRKEMGLDAERTRKARHFIQHLLDPNFNCPEEAALEPVVQSMKQVIDTIHS